MVVHLIDGTYELFRHFYGLRRFTHVKGSASRGGDRPYGGVIGVLQTVLQIIENENGAAYIGVATDHVIESFRNGLWPGSARTSAQRRWKSGVMASASLVLSL